MAYDKHLDILRQGAAAWNRWRAENPEIEPDLREALLGGVNLRGVDLSGVDLTEADLCGANLSEATLIGAELHGACLFRTVLCKANLTKASLGDTDLSEARLHRAILREAYLANANLFMATLTRATLCEAYLNGADLTWANLSGANLSEANLCAARLIGTDLSDAILTGCHVFGISAWRVTLDRATQQDLVITEQNVPQITADNLEVAQFIYLLLNNEKLRDVIDTITSKVVLILGRFTPERKAVLDALRGELRTRNYLPVLFDFQPSTHRSTVETVSTLAHMARFVIADLTDARSVLQELQAIVPNLSTVPVQPLILADQHEPGMLDSFCNYPWFLPILRYTALDHLLGFLATKIIAPAEEKARELQGGLKASGGSSQATSP